ncbi:cellulose synthase operon protein YhjQ [Pseudomonas asplenii]|uniref:Cellulose synthase operon protein YhjQ n=2 Tax=Pseudomonas asplenii TaxID=53407 RepID=A0A0M9GF21_9PSED|nr:cellulose biosynthesis protein BcsQ [Pseudomonas fuscovaginae]KPA89559.1 cellulose synthase operon protein YhjQ [Pseudomonas fuscovaginae]
MQPSDDDDVRNLMRKFGASTDRYREIEVARAFTEKPLPAPSPPPPAPTPAETPSLAVSPAIADPASSPSLRTLLTDLARQRQAQAEQHRQTPVMPHVAARIVAVVSTRGGVGRSTLASLLAILLNSADRQAVVLELDPQNAQHRHLGILPQAAGICRASLEQRSWQELAQTGYASTRLLPFGESEPQQLHGLERQLEDDPLWLARHLAPLHLGRHDTLIIDTPAGSSVFQEQALHMADLIVAVVRPDAASHAALEHLVNTLAPHLGGERPASCRFVINGVDSSHALSVDIAQILENQLKPQLLGTVAWDDAISEALAYECNPFEQSADARGCQDILAIADKLYDQLEPRLP